MEEQISQLLDLASTKWKLLENNLNLQIDSKVSTKKHLQMITDCYITYKISVKLDQQKEKAEDFAVCDII